MAAELTDDEMARDRRAEKIEKDLLEDYNEFTQWLQEEFSLTNKSILVHAYIADKKPVQAGVELHNMYVDYVQAKAWEMAE